MVVAAAAAITIASASANAAAAAVEKIWLGGREKLSPIVYLPAAMARELDQQFPV